MERALEPEGFEVGADLGTREVILKGKYTFERHGFEATIEHRFTHHGAFDLVERVQVAMELIVPPILAGRVMTESVTPLGEVTFHYGRKPA